MLRLSAFLATSGFAGLYGYMAISYTDLAQWGPAISAFIGIIVAAVAAAIPPLITAWNKGWEDFNATQLGQFEQTKEALKEANERIARLELDSKERDDAHRRELAKRDERVETITDQNEEQLRRLDAQSKMIVELSDRVGVLAHALDSFVCPKAVPGEPCANAVCPKIPPVVIPVINLPDNHEVHSGDDHPDDHRS